MCDPFSFILRIKHNASAFYKRVLAGECMRVYPYAGVPGCLRIWRNLMCACTCVRVCVCVCVCVRAHACLRVGGRAGGRA